MSRSPLRQNVERMFDRLIDGVALFSEHARVMRIGADAFETVKNERAQADDVVAEDRRVFPHGGLRSLREKAAHVLGWRENGGS